MNTDLEQSIKSVADWVNANKEWLFSGVGVAALALGARVVRRVRRPDQPQGTLPPLEPFSTASRRVDAHGRPSLSRLNTPGRIGTLCESILARLLAADGQPIYLAPILREGNMTKLELDEAVSILLEEGLVERLGGALDPPTLHLTALGRRYVVG